MASCRVTVEAVAVGSREWTESLDRLEAGLEALWREAYQSEPPWKAEKLVEAAADTDVRHG